MAPTLASKSPTIRRILREAQELAAAPSGDFAAAPLETDLFEWHFTLRGPPGSAYAGGLYHGRIVLPPTYPLRPPSFRFATPSGRFEANREICLSISGHHEETWQPAWGLRTALVALRAFMETDPRGQLGGLDASDATRRSLAAASPAWQCAACGRTNEAIMREAEAAVEAAAAEAGKSQPADNGSSSSTTTTVVPPELTMVWRDELAPATDASAPATATAPATPAAAPATAAAPAVPSIPAAATSTPPAPQPLPAAVRRPTSAIPRPTPTIPLPAAYPVLPDRPATMPPWIDRSIGILCAVLMALLVKMALAQ